MYSTARFLDLQSQRDDDIAGYRNGHPDISGGDFEHAQIMLQQINVQRTLRGHAAISPSPDRYPSIHKNDGQVIKHITHSQRSSTNPLAIGASGFAQSREFAGSAIGATARPISFDLLPLNADASYVQLKLSVAERISCMMMAFEHADTTIYLV